jgi:orotate phosphoribosyltransferase
VQEWLQRFEDAGAIWHYQAGGSHAAYDMADRHADFYFNTDVAASNPALMQDAADELVRASSIPASGNGNIWIASYTGSIAAGLVLATHISRISGMPLAYLDLRTEALNFPIAQGDTVAMVTDDIHSGGSLRKLIGVIKHSGAEILSPILTMANFSGNATLDGIAIQPLFAMEIETWAPADCHLCKAGSPALHARKHWGELCERQ